MINSSSLRNFLRKLISLTPGKELVPAALIFFVLALVCRPAMMKELADYARKPLLDPAGILQVHPWQEHNLHQFRAGHFPLWNQYTGTGQPHLANIQTGAFFPLWSLWMISGGGATLYGATLLFRLWLSAVLWFVFARRKLCGFPGALLAGAVYAFGGYAIPFAQLIDLNSQMLLPLLMLAFSRMIQKPALKNFLGSALLVCLAVLGGHPEAAFVTVLVATIYALFSFLAEHGHNRLLPARVLVLGASGVMGALLCAAVLLPFLNYLPRCWSMHGPGFGVFHLDPHGFVNLFFPDLYSAFQDMPARIPIEHLEKGPLQMLRLPYRETAVPGALPSAGPLVCVLALFGAVRARRIGWNALFFLGLFSVSAGLTFGLPGFRLIALVPPFNVNSNFKFFFSEIHVCLAMLAGVGAERLIGECKDILQARKKKFLPILFTVLFALIAGLSFFLLSQRALPSIFIALIVLISLHYKSRLATVLISVLVFLQLWMAAISFHPFVSLDRPEGKQKNELTVEIKSRLSPGARVTGLGRYWPPNLPMSRRLKDVRSSDALFYKPYVNLVRRVNRHSPRQNIDYFYPSYYTRPTPQGLAGADARDLCVGLAFGKDAWVPSQLIDGVLLKGRGIYGVAAPGKLRYDLISATECNDGPRRCYPGLFLHAPGRVSFRLSEVMAGDAEHSKNVSTILSFAPVLSSASHASPDGAALSALAQRGSHTELLYFRFMLPGENVYQNRSRKPQLLQAQSESSITLATAPGPRNNRDSDWTAFAALSAHHDEYRPPPKPAWSYEKSGPYLYEVPHKPWAHLKGSKEPLPVERTSGDSFWIMVSKTSLTKDLIVHEAWYPGWKARAGSEPLHIRPQEDKTALLVTVPPGANQASFYFEPPDFKVGLFVSITAVLLSLVVVLVSVKLGGRSGRD